ncbi:MAG: hypothetical protein AAF937_07195 [Planctomycetota bacterium]
MSVGGLTAYDALAESVTSRKRAKPVHRGADQLVATGALKLRQRRRRLDVLLRHADEVCSLAPEIRTYADVRLDSELEQMRASFMLGRVSDDVLIRAVALVREAGSRESGEEAYPVQIAGALALLHGRIAEMVTGEGKTLTGSLAVPLLAWRYRHVHVLTVNDYLAERDAESRGSLYKRCGLGVGAIQQDQTPADRARLYAGPIVYGTPKEIAADYLRDQIRMGAIDSSWSGWQTLGGRGPIVPGLQACLVDEADAVLIDEGVTPLIIARPREMDGLAPVYERACSIAASLNQHADYGIDLLRKKIRFTPSGMASMREAFARESDRAWRIERRGLELIRQALLAEHCYTRGQQYEIVDGRVVIVDEYTGRFLPDRSWEHGLHQAVEAKERVEITADRETLARVSFQRFFRSYRFLAGMTGTAADAAGEMERVYGRPVTVLPTHRPVAREQRPTRIFRNVHDKWSAIVSSIEREHAQGRPVLVGTRSVEASLHLSELLEDRGLPHAVLNAHNHAEEAATIAHAGEVGRITVATNMAGRGTDIKLTTAARERGGLHVILSEMHTARRVDRQFIGRAGRQGDPGSAEIFASLDDDLPSRFAPNLAALASRRSGPAERSGDRLAASALQLAQRRSESRDRRSRASVLRQDDWLEQHMPGR